MVERQAILALERARNVRVWRAEQKKRIRGGDIEHACALLQSGDDRLTTLEIGEFLVWLPKYGRARAWRVVRAAFAFPTQWSPARKIGTIDLMTLLRINAEIRAGEARSERVRQAEKAAA